MVNNVSLQVVADDREQLVAVKPVCEILGVDYPGQFAKLKEHPLYSSVIGLSSTTGAELTVAGKRFRHRSMDRDKVKEWLKAVRSGRIKPTQKGADWMNVEQRKDIELRNYEMIVSAAEEAVLVMNFFDTKDIQSITQYMYDRLLPHMVYYCCNTLRLPKDLSLNYTKQAAALIYTMLYDGKPITNMTKTAKRMLRVRKEHRDFSIMKELPMLPRSPSAT